MNDLLKILEYLEKKQNWVSAWQIEHDLGIKYSALVKYRKILTNELEGWVVWDWIGNNYTKPSNYKFCTLIRLTEKGKQGLALNRWGLVKEVIDILNEK